MLALRDVAARAGQGEGGPELQPYSWWPVGASNVGDDRVRLEERGRQKLVVAQDWRQGGVEDSWWWPSRYAATGILGEPLPAIPCCSRTPPQQASPGELSFLLHVALLKFLSLVLN
jgi:hypothetical protein